MLRYVSRANKRQEMQHRVLPQSEEVSVDKSRLSLTEDGVQITEGLSLWVGISVEDIYECIVEKATRMPGSFFVRRKNAMHIPPAVKTHADLFSTKLAAMQHLFTRTQKTLIPQRRMVEANEARLLKLQDMFSEMNEPMPPLPKE